MNHANIVGKLDSVNMLRDEKRVMLIVEYYDGIMEMHQHISVDITNELKDLFTTAEFDLEFVKKLEEKMKDVLKNELIIAHLSSNFIWSLGQPLNELCPSISTVA